MNEPIAPEFDSAKLPKKTSDTPSRRLFIALGLCAMIALGYAGCSWQNHRSGLECVKSWARVAAVPQDAIETRLSTGGNMFTRSFILEFDATPPELDDWLSKSPGLSGVTYQTILTETVRNQSFVQSINPGGNACFAQVTFMKALNGRIRVIIYTYWS